MSSTIRARKPARRLREEGYEVVLINSNPATIMTDPSTADRTYIEPLTWETVAKVIDVERPDAVLPTLGGQTGLNLAMDLHKYGVLQKYGVEMIGAKPDVIAKAEARDQFKRAMEKIGLEVCRGQTVNTMEQARRVQSELGLPCVVRPSFTLGGSGSGVAYNRDEFDQMVKRGLEFSPIHEVLLEESIVGWKEYEMEVMRDADDNVVIICSIENFDPMGVHTGDSITVAPAQTLSDKEYQLMRDASLAVIREIGVETGGSNIQFAIDPKTGRMIVIEMNPRVSRSSALASKATGFPIAKIAAKLAVGYRLHELANDITRETKACFEPTIDYVVTKIPRFAFEKFPEADAKLTTQMKSVGETMAIGGTFKESFQKALRGLEVGSFGFGCDNKDLWGTPQQPSRDEIRAKMAVPSADRVWYLRYAMKSGMTIDEIYAITHIDPWFLDNLQEIVELEEELRLQPGLAGVSDDLLRRAKRAGFSDRQLSTIWSTAEMDVRTERKRRGIVATFKSVDTCAAEFQAYTPYYYSTYETEDEVPGKPPGGKRIVILGGGPNRIGQGIEFDYCCCHASFALREMGIESVMINSNPETVSTDYDTSDMLFFEPLTTEDVLNVCDRVQPDGVIVQFGGQTPLNLARALSNAGVPIIGTSVDTIEDAEDREKFQRILSRLGLKQPANGIARTMVEARAEAAKIGFPALSAPQLRARWPGHGDLLRRGATGALRGRSLRRGPGSTGADRQVSRGRGRGRRGRHQRRRRYHHRRRHGAHRRGRRPLGRFGLRDSALQSAGPGDCRDQGGHAQTGPPSAGEGADEHPVRGQEGRRPTERVCARGQPARQPHGALRGQGDRHAGCKGGGQDHGRRVAGQPGHRLRSDSQSRLGQGERVSVRQIPGRRHRAGARNAFDWRSDGHQRSLLDRLCQEPARSRRVAAQARQHLHQPGGAGQEARCSAGEQIGRNGLPVSSYRRHRANARTGGAERPACQEAAGGASQPARLFDQRRNSIDHQHAQRQGRPHRRRTDPRGQRLARRALHHDHPRG